MNIFKTLLLTGVIALTSSCNDQGGAVENSKEVINLPIFENYEKFTGGAQISFNEYEHDFGTVSKKNELEHTFYFINSGDSPLIINDAKGSCGCTVPFFPKDPIAPGQQEKIDVNIDPINKEEGKLFSVRVRVESNAENKFVTLNLMGTPEDQAKK